MFGNLTQPSSSGSAATYSSALFISKTNVEVTNTDVETTLVGAGSGSMTIPANYIKAGSVIYSKMRGYAESGDNSATIFNVYLGANTLYTNNNGLGNNQRYWIDVEILFQSIGAAGVYVCWLRRYAFTDADDLDFSDSPMLTNKTIGTLNTTVSNLFNYTATPGANNPVLGFTSEYISLSAAQVAS